MYIYDISLFSTENKNCFRQCFRENQNTYFTFSNVWTENRVVYDIILKNSVDLRPHMRFACWITKTADNTLRICNTYCFSTATTVTREHLNVTLYAQCLSCLFISSSPISSKTRLYYVLIFNLIVKSTKFWHVSILQGMRSFLTPNFVRHSGRCKG